MEEDTLYSTYILTRNERALIDNDIYKKNKFSYQDRGRIVAVVYERNFDFNTSLPMGLDKHETDLSEDFVSIGIIVQVRDKNAEIEVRIRLFEDALGTMLPWMLDTSDVVFHMDPRELLLVPYSVAEVFKVPSNWIYFDRQQRAEFDYVLSDILKRQNLTLELDNYSQPFDIPSFINPWLEEEEEEEEMQNFDFIEDAWKDLTPLFSNAVENSDEFIEDICFPEFKV